MTRATYCQRLRVSFMGCKLCPTIIAFLRLTPYVLRYIYEISPVWQRWSFSASSFTCYDSSVLSRLISNSPPWRFHCSTLYPTNSTKQIGRGPIFTGISLGTRSMQKNTASVAFNYRPNPLHRAFERKQSRFRRSGPRMKNIETRDHLIFDLRRSRGLQQEGPAVRFFFLTMEGCFILNGAQALWRIYHR